MDMAVFLFLWVSVPIRGLFNLTVKGVRGTGVIQAVSEFPSPSGDYLI